MESLNASLQRIGQWCTNLQNTQQDTAGTVCGLTQKPMVQVV